ncbi:nuclear envelope pore membrane protein POM 121C-like [Equus quagga]|uniref:nuclear envelope pore membrane protein POM 121C-like n=1 Tax=Equus quagga TaxID=89248 RepID=UPI001EE334C2|nr:nuclear envelope pore membrane protein POM 121C-like [Equus quagga]
MGGSQSRLCPSRPPQAPWGQRLPRGLRRLQPLHRTCRLPLAVRGHPAVHVPPLTRRTSCRNPATSHPRFLIAPPRWGALTRKILRSFLGVLSSICRPGHQNKAMLSALTPEKSCSSPSAEDKVTPCVVQEQGVTPMPPTTPRCAQDRSTDKMLLRTPGESRKETAEQEEDPPVIERQDDEGRGPDNPGEASSAFRPLGLQGGLCSIVPRPGPLQGTHHSMRSEDRSIHKSQTSCMSSCPRRNAITSSYSSTRGFPSVQRRMGPATAHTWLPQRPSEKVIPEGRGSPSAGSGLSHRKLQRGKDAPGQTESQSICSPIPDRSRPRKRKTPLLPSRHGAPLSLPPALELGFRVTVEDLASEKEAALRTIDSALRGETEAVRDHGTTQPSCSVSMPSAATAPPPAVPLAPSMTSEWGKRRKVQDTMGPLTILQTAGAATVGHPLWHRKHSSPGPLLSLSQPLPGTSSPSLPSPMSTLLTPASSLGSGRDELPARCPSALLPAPGPALGMESAIGSPTSACWAPAPAAASPPCFLLKSTWGHPRNGGGGGHSKPKAAVSAAADASSAFSAAWSTSPMCTDSPVSTSQRPPPITDPGAPPSTGLPIIPAGSSSPSPCISTGLAPWAAADTEVTPMDTTPAPQPLLEGSAAGSSGSISSPALALQMSPRDSMASVTSSLSPLRFCGRTPTPKLPTNPGAVAQSKSGAPDGQQHGATTLPSSLQKGTRAAPATPRAPTSAPGQPAGDSTTWAVFGVATPTPSILGTHSSTWPGLAATPAVFPSGTAHASGLAPATYKRSTVTHAGTRMRQPQSQFGSRSHVPFRLQVLVASKGFDSRSALSFLTRSFSALSLRAQTSVAPSTTHRYGGSLGQNTWGPPPQSVPMVTARPSTRQNPGSGCTTAPSSSRIPGGLCRKRRLTSG